MSFWRNQPTGLCFHLFAMIQTCTYLYPINFTPQVKEAGNQSQMFNRKSISRNFTHRQSYHLIQIEQILEHFTQHYFNLHSTTNQKPLTSSESNILILHSMQHVI